MFLILFGLRRRAPSCVPSRVTCSSAFNLAIKKCRVSRGVLSRPFRASTGCGTCPRSLLGLFSFQAKPGYRSSSSPSQAKATNTSYTPRYNAFIQGGAYNTNQFRTDGEGIDVVEYVVANSPYGIDAIDYVHYMMCRRSASFEKERVLKRSRTPFESAAMA